MSRFHHASSGGSEANLLDLGFDEVHALHQTLVTCVVL